MLSLLSFYCFEPITWQNVHWYSIYSKIYITCTQKPFLWFCLYSYILISSYALCPHPSDLLYSSSFGEGACPFLLSMHILHLDEFTFSTLLQLAQEANPWNMRLQENFSIHIYELFASFDYSFPCLQGLVYPRIFIFAI